MALKLSTCAFPIIYCTCACTVIYMYMCMYSIQLCIHAVISYCRSALFNVIKSLCKSEEVSTSLTFDSLPSFLLSEANLHCLTMEDLPLDNHSLFNSCIITSPHTPVWPLILDPWGMVKQWLHKRRGPKETTFVKFEVISCVL